MTDAAQQKTSLKQLIYYAQGVQTQIRERAKAEGGEFMMEVLKPIFEYDDQIAAVRWIQYTPYFNDGEPCVFGVHFEGRMRLAGVDPEEIEEMSDYEDEFISTWTMKWKLKDHKDGLPMLPDHWTLEYVEELDKIVQQISKLMYKSQWARDAPADAGILSDLMETMFGDHVQVTVTRVGEVTVEEYNHD